MKKNNEQNGAALKAASFEYSKLFSELEITHFFSTRAGGVSDGLYSELNLGEYCGDKLENVRVNRELVCSAVGAKRLFVPREIHESEICEIDDTFLSLSETDVRERLLKYDALVTNVKEICIGVTTADCVPLLLFDKANNASAAIHAGWRGVVKEIAAKTINMMANIYGSEPANIFAATGPAISADIFEVGPEVVAEFEKVFSPCDMSLIKCGLENGKATIDLQKALEIQLTNSGISMSHIDINTNCTYTNSRYFSARRDGLTSGRAVSAIMLR